MKKTFILFAALIVLGTITANAKVWRVNNNLGVDADFTTVQAAHDAANTDDTIYVEGSQTAYGNCNMIKKLVVIGPGYFLTENLLLQHCPYNAYCDFSFEFNFTDPFNHLTSSGSKIYGMFGAVTITVSDITVENCFVTGGCPINANVNNIIFKKNMMGSISAATTVNNCIISNCLFTSSVNFGTSSSGIFQNNIIASSISLYNFSIKNNIETSLTATVTTAPSYNNLIYNNISVGSQFGILDGNQANVNPSDIFVCWSTCTSYSSDGRYALKAGSPAIATGEGGVDCGIFGGSNPYVLSGIPSIPAIYFLNTTNSPTQGISVTIKTKSH